MILGIVLHASLAYFPFPWPAQDPRQQTALGFVYAAIHGFRMPLFFLLSGFFTMLVLRRRGLQALLFQRTLRILLPLSIAAVTILPLDKVVFSWAIRRSAGGTAAQSPLREGILASDAAAVQRLLKTDHDLTSRDLKSGLTPLALAAMGGDTSIVTALLEAGSAVDATSRDGSTPLHAAVFMGQDGIVQLLLDRGADPTCRNAAGTMPIEAVGIPGEIASRIGEFLGLPIRPAADVERGRDRARDLLAPLTPATAMTRPLDALAARYQAALAAPRYQITLGGKVWQSFQSGIFDHLWFLWHLCWLVAAFAIADVVGLAPTGRLRWWLIPASCLPFALMWSPFGPDTALGLLPAPHLLLFYGCFFWFGAGTYAAEGAETPLGRHWKIVLPLSLLMLFPAAIATMGDRPLASVLQPAFAWAGSIGLIGLFRRFFSGPSPAVRWLADATYWMYLAHLPLVVVCQSYGRDLPWPAAAKFLAVIAVTVAVLLVTYQWCVRFTPIGWLLNGPRSHHPAAPHA